MSKMLTFSDNLYMGDSMDLSKLDTIKEELIHTPVAVKAFLITLSANPADQLDIIEAKYLTFPYYNDHPLHVVGLAGSNGEAIHLIEKITQNCLDTRGDVNLKEYLINQI